MVNDEYLAVPTGQGKFFSFWKAFIESLQPPRDNFEEAHTLATAPGEDESAREDGMFPIRVVTRLEFQMPRMLQ